MRLRVPHRFYSSPVAAVFLFIFFLGTGSRADAQNPDTMMPEQNVAKAREILAQLTEALGGPAFLEARKRECDGRRAQIGHSGELTGFIDFKDYWEFPDKHRTEYSKKRNIIDLFSGDEGWTMDRGGVSEEPAAAVQDFRMTVKHGVDNLLRAGIQDKNLRIHYGGPGIVDMKQVEWVEVVDPERTLRVAVDRTSHLLMRTVLVSIDEISKERTEETTIYTNYQRKDGVMVALQVSRERDGRRVYQAFFENCRFNTSLPEDFFTRSSLEKRYAEVGNKKEREKYKNSKD